MINHFRGAFISMHCICRERLQIQIHVCGNYVLLVRFTLNSAMDWVRQRLDIREVIAFNYYYYSTFKKILLHLTLCTVIGATK